MSKSEVRLFVQMYHDVMDTPAWRTMSHGARNLYVALKRSYNRKARNNGRIFLSVRDASLMIKAHKDLVSYWFKELQHYGFIVMTRQGALGIDGKGRAPHWRLTEEDADKPATMDFQSWDGTPFQPRKRRREPWPSNGGPPLEAGPKKIKSRPTRGGHPVPHGADIACPTRGGQGLQEIQQNPVLHGADISRRCSPHFLSPLNLEPVSGRCCQHRLRDWAEAAE
jgi:hypothetical protein